MKRFSLHDGRWSEPDGKATAEGLADYLVALEEADRRNEDPCREMSRWAALQICGQILDLGCGTAWKARCLSRDPANRVVACDPDAHLLGYGRKKNGFRQIVQCDGNLLPFPAESFDWVLAIEVIEHVEQPRKLLAEVARVLRSGGRVLMTTPNRLQYFRPWRPKMFYLAMRRQIVLDRSHVREFDAAELQGLLPPSLSPERLLFRGMLCGRPFPIDIGNLPTPLRRWWAQGLELVAEKRESR